MCNRCLLCFESLLYQSSINRYFLGSNDEVCCSCRMKMNKLNRDILFNGTKVRVVYMYDTYLEGILFQYKECRDIALSKLFLYEVVKELNDKFRTYTLVFMPSNENKTKERGFHALEQMCTEIKLKKIHLFKKKKTYKQSSQTFEDRVKIANVMFLDEKVEMPKGKLLLFDDVATSGSTIKHALFLLKDYPYDIEVFLFSASEGFVESCDLFHYANDKKFHILKRQ